ncbi:ankyrin repeat domain-containing protein [Sansalvadorimonas verongulae]|uniref:ankyrin repeat domain-containing protein n=1 Tax=Sansalvadorimonas verongulae TaxID=2172824 RepID=UPI0012BC7B41|nr:ankyrin repeat domain-containing protein [Sansalvadorimonas verongulae]MTI12066.1 hypothetical protein [Sansalvadorimonas verongulae]
MLRVHENQRWFYTSFFIFVFGFCANVLAMGECEAVFSKELEMKYDEHDFLAACREGNVDVVQYFLDLEGFNVNKQFISGVNGEPVHGLFIAAQHGHIEVVKVLVDCEELDIDQTYNGATPLFQAVQESHTEVVRILLEAGADPKMKWHFWGFCSKNLLTNAKDQKPLFLFDQRGYGQEYTQVIEHIKEKKRLRKERHRTSQSTQRANPIDTIRESHIDMTMCGLTLQSGAKNETQ